MSDFMTVPVVESFNIESVDSGLPFTSEAMILQQSSFLYRGIYIGALEEGISIARVKSTLYALSLSPSRCYVWYAGNNFTTPYDTEKSNLQGMYYTLVTDVKSYSANLTNFSSVDDMLEAYYNTSVFPDSSVSDGDILVIARPLNGVGVIDVNLSPYIDGAEFINVDINGNTIDANDSGGTSTSSFPEGNFDDTSDKIPIPSLPTISSVNTGLVTLFRPTNEQIARLGAYLWTHLGDFWQNLQKLFTNPMDYFISFNIFPVMPAVAEEREIYIGNWGTSIEMPPVVSQWFDFDCGEVSISPYWGSALDYAPNTKIQLMLPFIGSVQINTDEVMGHMIGVRYRIDLLSGQCVALVTKDSDVLYQFTGECAVSVPLTGADWSRIYSAVVGAVGTAIAGGVGVAAAGAVGGTGGLVAARSYEAAAAGGAAWASINETSKGVRGVAEMRQRMLDVSNAAMENARNAASKSVRRSEGVRNMRLANTVNNTVGQVMGAKSAISHSGTISGAAGMLGVRDAYFIIEYPNQSLAENYKHFVGYPSNIYASLGSLHGYTECEQVLPIGIWGTDDELAEIIDILKGGVYL